MRQPKAKSKLEKCKYKRCMYKRTMPIEKPRYCGKHVDIALASLNTPTPIVDNEPKLNQPTLGERIMAFVWKSQ